MLDQMSSYMHVTVGAYRSQRGRLFLELHFILCGCWELGADAFQEQGMFSPAPLNKSIGKDSMVSQLDIMTRVKGLLSFLSHCMRDQVAVLVSFLKIQVSTVFPEKAKILIWIIISILRKGTPEILPQIQWCHCSAFKPKLMLPSLPILWSRHREVIYTDEVGRHYQKGCWGACIRSLLGIAIRDLD